MSEKGDGAADVAGVISAHRRQSQCWECEGSALNPTALCEMAGVFGHDCLEISVSESKTLELVELAAEGDVAATGWGSEKPGGASRLIREGCMRGVLSLLSSSFTGNGCDSLTGSTGFFARSASSSSTCFCAASLRAMVFFLVCALALAACTRTAFLASLLMPASKLTKEIPP